MPNYPVLSAKSFLKMLLCYGCAEISVKGSHHRVKNAINNKSSVVPVHGGQDIKKALMLTILEQLGIDADDFFHA